MHDREVYLNKVTITLCQFIVIWFIFIMALHIKMNGEKYILPPFKKNWICLFRQSNNKKLNLMKKL